MKLVKRFDYEASVGAQPEITPEGFLKVFARATRTGVLVYKQADGSTIRELRHPDEVFKPESMQTLALKPMTNRHPPGLIDSETASMYQVGMTGETVKIADGKFLDVMCVITDKAAIADAKNGKAIEVSPGYTCELDFTPGVYEGEAYDAVQRNIRYNHLAQVTKGRSGPEVRLRLDSDEAVQVELNPKKEKVSEMKKIKLDGKEFEVADEAFAAIEALQARFDALTGESKKAAEKLAETVSEKEKAQARADGLDNELKKLKAERADAAPVDLKAAVKARVRLEKIAEKAGVEKFDAMDDLELKKAVIHADDADFKLDGKSEAYIEARFDMAAEALERADSSATDLGEKIVSSTRTETMDSGDARQKMIERTRNLWKNSEKGE